MTTTHKFPLQYTCETDHTASPAVEVEVLGIPKDCVKYRTKTCARNALNPIWEDTFSLEVVLPELAFLRLTVMDTAAGGQGAPTAQRVIPLHQLRPGYRHVPLADMKGNPLPLSSLFILSVFHPDSVDPDEPSAEALQRKRMSFLLIHDVGEQDPYAILKVTNESTAQEVIKMALAKVGQAASHHEFVLLEEFGGEGGNGGDEPAPQHRLVGMEEIPLSVRSQWKSDGKFVLKRVGLDPSWRARLGNMIGPPRRLSTMFPHNTAESVPGGGFAESDETEAESDNFRVAVFNVSPGVAHTILQVSKSSSAQQVIAAALAKTRSLADPKSFVLVEETEAETLGGGSGRRHKPGKKQLVQRVLNDDQNVYLVQGIWKGRGKLTLLERGKHAVRGSPALQAEAHQSIRETQSEPICRASPRLRRPNYLVGRVRKFSRSLYGYEDGGQHPGGVVSDGEVSDEDEESLAARKSSMANLRKLKIW